MAFLLFSSAFLSILVALSGFMLVQPVSSVPCPEQTTPFYGPTTSTNYTQVVEDQDDSTRIAAMYYCVQPGWGHPRQHLEASKPRLKLILVLVFILCTFYQQYGTFDTPGDTCEEIIINEETMYVEIFSDSNDIEGKIRFLDLYRSSWYDIHHASQWLEILSYILDGGTSDRLRHVHGLWRHG